MVDPQKPCVKCEAVEWNAIGQCKNCRRAINKTYRQSSEVLAKKRASQRKYRNSPEGVARIKAYMKKYYQSANRREKRRVWQINKRKLQFEFSLQNQAKAIETCQPKST